MPTPMNLRGACPACAAPILVPFMSHATDQYRRKCRCGQRWSILVKPMPVSAPGVEAVHHLTFFRMPPQTQHALNGVAGLVRRTRSRITGTEVGLYNAEQAGMDSDEGRNPWATVCEVHHNVCAHPTFQLARSHAADPTGWCGACQDAVGAAQAASGGPN